MQYLAFIETQSPASILARIPAAWSTSLKSVFVSFNGLEFIRPFLFRDFPHPGNVRQYLIQRYRQCTEVIHLVEKKIILAVGGGLLQVVDHLFRGRKVFLLGVALAGQHPEMNGQVVVETLGFNQDCRVGFV